MNLPAPPTKPTRLAYLGTPEVAVQPLRALVEAGFKIPIVITRPDKRRGRGTKTTPSPVKAAAIELGLDVADNLDALDTVDVDLGVVVAFGRIIPTELLERLPMVNIHFSLLPRWRGAAPVERAILAGDETTGVCLMAIAPELDTGDVYQRREVAIDGNEMLDELRSRLVDVGSQLLVETLRTGIGTPQPQVGDVTYAPKIDPAEYRLHFDRPARDLHAAVRLGRAWCTFRGKRLKITEAAIAHDEPGIPQSGRLEPGQLRGDLVGTADGVLQLLVVQPEGKRPMPVSDWLNGAQPRNDERLV